MGCNCVPEIVCLTYLPNIVNIKPIVSQFQAALSWAASYLFENTQKMSAAHHPVYLRIDNPMPLFPMRALWTAPPRAGRPDYRLSGKNRTVANGLQPHRYCTIACPGHLPSKLSAAHSL